jgi:hypothetical protein
MRYRRGLTYFKIGELGMNVFETLLGAEYTKKFDPGY